MNHSEEKMKLNDAIQEFLDGIAFLYPVLIMENTVIGTSVLTISNIP